MAQDKKTIGAQLATWLKTHIMYVVLLVLILFFSTQKSTFLSLTNLRNILDQSSYIIVVGVGVCLCMLSGGMDLSVGYQMSLVGVILALLMTKTPIPWPVCILITLVLGCVLSLVNGILFVKMSVFPFIITLATQYCYQGISYMISGSKTISDLPAAFKYIGQRSIGGVLPISIVIMVVCVLIGSFILNRTYFGHFYIYGLGGNPEAVSLAGVNTKKVYLLIYALAGLFIGLGTVMLVSRTGSAASSMGPGTEFTIIAGGMLGGIKLGGGGGKISSVVVGILILSVLSNGMQLMQLGNYPQYLAKGLVLIIAIGFDAHQSMAVLKKAKKVEGTAPESPQKSLNNAQDAQE